jgi:hypothetical protein
MDSLSEYLSRTQKSEGNGTHDKSSDFMNMRNKPKETRENLRGSSHTADYERGIDCLIRGLVDLLPKPDSVWTIEDRAKWLRLAAGIFDLGYKSVDGEYDDISIVPVKQVAAKPRQ